MNAWRHRLQLRSLALAALTALLCGATAWGAPVVEAQYEVSIREVFIPMKDHVRLAATLYLPTPKRAGEKFAAALEYIPYRKDDGANHAPVHSYFARHGFVS